MKANKYRIIDDVDFIDWINLIQKQTSPPITKHIALQSINNRQKFQYFVKSKPIPDNIYDIIARFYSQSFIWRHGQQRKMQKYGNLHSHIKVRCYNGSMVNNLGQ
eukprot:468590_1